MKMAYKGCQCNDCRKQREEEERANYVPTWSDRHPVLFGLIMLMYLIPLLNPDGTHYMAIGGGG